MQEVNQEQEVYLEGINQLNKQHCLDHLRRQVVRLNLQLEVACLVEDKISQLVKQLYLGNHYNNSRQTNQQQVVGYSVEVELNLLQEVGYSGKNLLVKQQEEVCLVNSLKDK